MIPDSPYAVIAISTLFLLMYCLTLLFTRTGMFSKAAQRKFWNVLLLLALAGTGLLGIFLAVTVNYKISMPITDQLLVWHVDFGIALFIVSIFHFTWHAKYYLKLIKKGKYAENITIQHAEAGFDNRQQELSNFPYHLIPFLLGFTSMATQLILLREFLTVFSGNELVIGIVLADWMLLTGLGALMSWKSPKTMKLKGIMISLYVLALLPFIILFLLDGTRNIVLPVGGMPGLTYMFLASVILLAPFCILSGWLFGSISGFLSGLGIRNPVSTVYGWETTGSIASGLLCSMVLIYLFEPFQSLSLLLLINGLVHFSASRRHYPIKRIIILPAFSLVILMVIFSFRIDRVALQLLFPGQDIVSFKDTPQGKLVVTQNADQFNFFENNSLLFTTNNVITNEETAHYALLQRADTGNLLLIGGGASGLANECLKYPFKRVDIMDINPRIVILGKEFHRFPADKRVRILQGDPRLLVNRKSKNAKAIFNERGTTPKMKDSLRYDAVLIDVPEPSTLQINRFYTLEFFKMLESILVKDGIISLSLAPTTDYTGSEAVKIQSTIFQTMKSVYSNVLIIQGEKNYFLASDGSMTPKVAKIAAQRGIRTEYVNEYYLDNASLEERSNLVEKSISVPAKINRDFNPVGCYRQYNYWLSYAGNTGLWYLVIPLILVILFSFVRSYRTTVALFIAGFTSFVTEIMLLLVLQVVYGYIYILAGIFITLFMAGLAAGVFIARPGKSTLKLLRGMQLISSCFPLIVLLMLYLVETHEINTWMLVPLFGVLNIGVAFVTGYLFHIASSLRGEGVHRVASVNYSADLLGSASGAVIINAWMVPVYGFHISLLITAGISFLALASNYIRKK